ncbi:protein lifeguard 3-like isoform X1 [Dermochelys coriacea]|uniref:protein lifeguard 3-like isoform X1 n=1 Tax=Dermochelys coriacea TaxID=27794 RepID=UPI0018E8D058|nr:protein lifeguard 3-like isoform X1 [Dermochelys coriacea]XP_038277757.1 protein lifeguard 3-like isoform X1 [Dermochelys coriacea]
MSYPSAPPPYDDKNPLYPPQPGGHPQPGAYPGGYPQPIPYPGSYRQPGGYPGGYPQPGGYTQPGVPLPPMSTLPMNLGDTGLPTGNSYITSLGDDVIRTIDWDDKRVRHAFIRKVYTIISVQLLVTVGIIAVFTFVSPVRAFVQGNIIVYYSSYAVFLVSYLVLACCPGPRRCFPWNLILLAIFTLAMGFMTGTIASMYETMAVLIAMVITAIVAIIVTIFCFQTKVDFTSCTGLFCVLGIVVLLTSTVSAIVLYYKCIQWVHMLFAAVVAIAFTLFLAYDTQVLVGTKEYDLSPEEYVFGALEIYVDIVYIFLFLLQFLGCK